MKHEQSCDNHVRFRAGCPPCQVAARYYEKRRLLWLGRGVRKPGSPQPAALTTQRLRELRALGYDLETLAAETGLGWATVKRISQGDCKYVFLRVFLAVESTYARLSSTPGGSGRAAVWARKHGWDLPALDDEPLAAVIDAVTVERLISGQPTPATRDEMTEAWRQLTEAGMSDKESARRLGVSDRTLQRWKKQVPKAQRRTA